MSTGLRRASAAVDFRDDSLAVGQQERQIRVIDRTTCVRAARRGFQRVRSEPVPARVLGTSGRHYAAQRGWRARV